MNTFMDGMKTRLRQELEGMERLSCESSRFSFTSSGVPPTIYEVTFGCKGLVSLSDGIPQYGTEHRATIILHDDYPLSEASMEILWHTDILHPNIDLENGPCIKGTPLGGDIRVADICEFLWEMIQLKRYNLSNRWKSDASRAAAAWIKENRDQLPLEDAPLRDGAVR